jgi:hypothetical protein
MKKKILFTASALIFSAAMFAATPNRDKGNHSNKGEHHKKCEHKKCCHHEKSETKK